MQSFFDGIKKIAKFYSWDTNFILIILVLTFHLYLQGINDSDFHTSVPGDFCGAELLSDDYL